MQSTSQTTAPDPNRQGMIVQPDFKNNAPTDPTVKPVTMGGGTADRRRSMLGVGTKKTY